jgi:hypothetical protein
MLKKSKTKEHQNKIQQPMQGKGKRGRPRKIWRVKVEEYLNIMGRKTGRQWPETVGNGGRLYWKPKSTTDC